MKIELTSIKNILTRSSGYLKNVCSHSLQPYQGCALGHSLCGVGCYVQHNPYITKGRTWGSFVEIRQNASQSYIQQYPTERQWAKNKFGQFGIFMSSSTEPFQPLERKWKISYSLLKAMLDNPPDLLILQTHSHTVTDYLDLYKELNQNTRLRFHISIESDMDQLPGLPSSASSVLKRMQAAQILKQNGLPVVITIAPLLPIQNPENFFARLKPICDGVVIDHFIKGDGSKNGSRTLKTSLPHAMYQINPKSTGLAYRDYIACIAQKYFPGQIGISIDGFAGITSDKNLLKI